MQKLLRRTAQAKAQASRRTKNQVTKSRTENRKLRHYQYIEFNRAVLQDVKNAQFSRREDHLLGPLAPRRDVGSKRDTYGTVDERRLRGPGMKGIGVEKGGRPEEWTGIKEGDRVVVVGKEVRDWGKVGLVREVRANQGDCAVEGLNMVRPCSLSTDSSFWSHGFSLKCNTLLTLTNEKGRRANPRRRRLRRHPKTPLPLRPRPHPPLRRPPHLPPRPAKRPHRHPHRHPHPLSKTHPRPPRPLHRQPRPPSPHPLAQKGKTKVRRLRHRHPAHRRRRGNVDTHAAARADARHRHRRTEE